MQITKRNFSFENWCFEQHQKVNQLYDKYLPYEFHLRMVKNVGNMPEFKTVIDYVIKTEHITLEELNAGLVGHDLIEDCHHINHSDIFLTLSKYPNSNLRAGIVADMIFGCSNSTGKTSEERHDNAFYERVKNHPGSRFVKICDRIANVQYGLMMKSSMTIKYKTKNERFKNNLYKEEYKVMFDYLDDLFVQVK